MPTTNVRIIAIAAITIVIAGGLIAIRMHHEDADVKGSGNVISAAKAKLRDAESHNPFAGLSLEEWKQKISGTDVSDFQKLMTAAMLITDEQVRDEVMVTLVDRWMLENPAEFIKYLSSIEVAGNERALALVAKALEVSLTKLDPQRGASDEILVIAQRLIDYLATTDPEKALEWSKKWLLDDTLENAMVAVVRSVARTDIERSLAILKEMKSPLRRSQALAAVGAIWAERDPNAALKWAIAIPNHADRALTLNSVLLAIAQTNPAGAAADLTAQAREISEQYKAQRAADLAAKGLSEADFVNDPDNYREMRESGAIPAPDSPDVELLSTSGSAIGAKLAQNNPANGVALVDSIDHEYLKLKTLAGVMEGWAKTDPQTALDYINKNYPGNSDLLKALYGSWAVVDPIAAANGTSLITDPALHSIALEVVVKSANGKVNEVADYISQSPVEGNTDSVKLALANAMSYNSPREAWDIAVGISDTNIQYRGLKSAFANLVIQNPDAAGALLNSSNLPNSTSERLRDMLDAVVGN